MVLILVIIIYYFINLIIINILRNIYKNCWMVYFILELIINEINFDESDICFLDILLKNILDNDNEMLIFLELLK